MHLSCYYIKRHGILRRSRSLKSASMPIALIHYAVAQTLACAVSLIIGRFDIKPRQPQGHQVLVDGTPADQVCAGVCIDVTKVG